MQALNILKKYWGYNSFRPLQEDIISSVLEGHDTLGLMPTGGGKSITFQVPGLVFDGLTIVITPLISLMKDQVDNLRRRRIEAVFFHSGMSRHDITVAWERLVNNRARFLYVAPERLKNTRFLAEIRSLPVRLIVVDEAHCISQWGYDFRPDYLNINKLRTLFAKVTVLALTATATPAVADDICRQLNFHSDARRFTMSFARRNISYVVRKTESKLSEILHILTHTSGCSIVYVRSRRRTREIAEYLSNAGISATFYHAGLDFMIKEERQNAWKSDQVRVMVATNAFGMGIDKPDVRVVIHYDMPPSLEEYYQEAGRAGRDTLPSYAVLLFSQTDPGVIRRRLTKAFPERNVIRRIYELISVFIGKFPGEGYDTISEFDIDRFCHTFHMAEDVVKASLSILSRAGYLDYIEDIENRSRVKMAIIREDLYRINTLSTTAEKVLGRILRSYPGLFSDYVFISEPRLCRELDMSENDLYEAMLELSREKVLLYVPRRLTPYIYLPTAIEEAKYIEIGRAVYEERRKIYKTRIEAMIAYASASHECRVAGMLRYFGEPNPTDCETCDICRTNRKKRGIPANSLPQADMERIVTEYLTSRPEGVTPGDIEHDFGIHTTLAMDTLRAMAGEGGVKVSRGRYRLV